jgi:stage V sporulation protein D (sporulation-specific penicillin-binding protein)
MFARLFGISRDVRRQTAGDAAAHGAVARVMQVNPVDGRPADRAEAQFDVRWRTDLKRRVVVLLCALGLWSVALEARLIHLQVFRHDEMVKRASEQQHSVLKLIPARGDIIDRNGQILAYTVEGAELVADPSSIEDVPKAVAQLCEALRDCSPDRRASLLKNLSRKGQFAYLERQLSPEQVPRIEALKLTGVRIQPQPRRYYPKVDLAAHVLGFVGLDNEGLGGVERAYDKVIKGTEGRMLLQVDARRKVMDSRVQIASEPGAKVELTIDLYLQHIAERELAAGVEADRAAGGTAIIMNPLNGEILALASYPTFNPNVYQQFSENQKRNRAIQDVYEPGSTFKIVTASAALEEHVMQPTDQVDTNPGRISFGSRVVTEAKGHNYGVLSFEDVIVRSSNIGAIKIGMRVGADRMGRYIRRFGFGQALLPDLRGESQGIVWNPVNLSESALASMAMGYQVSVTPLQMALAASTVANGGTLYEPHLVRAIVRDNVRQPIQPKALRQAINKETASELTTIMEGVVSSKLGTGGRAQLEGYQVAGKTGTASKLVDGHYSHSEYNVSFVGFVPARSPVFTILVMIDTPRNGSPYGGTVAAPIFQRIAEAALRQLAVTPTINPPPVILASEAAGLAHTVSAPAVRAVVPTLDGQPVMPDVRGLSARDAVRVLGSIGLSVHVSGSGFVSTQTPAPGEPIESGGQTPSDPHPSGGGAR